MKVNCNRKKYYFIFVLQSEQIYLFRTCRAADEKEDSNRQGAVTKC